MKKLLSLMLAIAMLVTSVSMTVSAFDTITVPTEAGEYVLLEMEDYNDFRITNQTFKAAEGEMEGLSGGKGIYSGSTSMNLTTLTLPISVAKDTVYEMEMVAGCNSSFTKNYWSLDGATMFYTTPNLGTALTNENGDPIYFTNTNKHFPAGKFVQTFAITAGKHDLVFNVPSRGTETGAFALDYLKLTATDKVSPDITFAEGATASAVANGKTAAVTFTDSGTETVDGTTTPVKKYAIEIIPAETTATTPVMTYYFDTELAGQEARPTVFTAHFNVPQVLCGPFYAKVYPMGVTYSSQRGNAIQSAVFTIKEDAPGYAVRYEVEDYWTYGTEKNTTASSKFASNGKMIVSAQNAQWIDKSACIEDKNADYWQDVYEVSFEADLPVDGTYDVETIMGKGDGEWTDKVEVFLDDSDTPIYTNTAGEMSEVLSVNGYYPYLHIYAGRYNKDVELSAGKHNVKVVITRPRQAAQPHLFMVDYIQFTPDTVSIDMQNGYVFETEDYKDAFYAFDGEGNTEKINLGVVLSGNASGGAAATYDSTPSLGRVPVKAEIPFTVKESGYYLVESIDSNGGCDGFVSVSNGTETKNLIDKLSSGVRLLATNEDAVQENRPNWYTYFGVKWHNARRSVQLNYLEEGDYTMTIQYNERSSASAVAFMMDYVKIYPYIAPVTNVPADGTVIELDTVKDYFLQDDAIAFATSVQNHEDSTGGKHITTTEIAMKTGHAVELPIKVEKAGWYNLESVLSLRNSGGWTSEINISVDDEVVLINDRANSVEDISKPYVENGTETYGYVNVNYPMHRFAKAIYLEAGDHVVDFHAKPRTQKVPAEKEADEKAIAEGKEANPFRVCYHADYISLTPVNEEVTVDGTAVNASFIYAEEESGVVMIAAYAGTKLVGVNIVDADYQDLVDTAFECTEAPDTVKVMVWNAPGSMKPLAQPVTYTFE